MLRQCDSYSKYFVPECKYFCTDVTPRIEFHVYQLFFTPFLHVLLEEGRLVNKVCDTEIGGKIRSRKMY